MPKGLNNAINTVSTKKGTNQWRNRQRSRWDDFIPPQYDCDVKKLIRIRVKRKNELIKSLEEHI